MGSEGGLVGRCGAAGAAVEDGRLGEMRRLVCAVPSDGFKAMARRVAARAAS